MKKVFGLAIIASFLIIGCKTQESAYRKPWEKAQAQQAQDAQNNPTVPVVSIETPVNTVDESENLSNNNDNNVNNNDISSNNVINNDNNSNNNSYTYNTNNNVDEFSTANVKRYCVVVGSFESLSGAEQRRQSVINNGYGSARIIRGGLGYRVVATSFNDIQSARSSRNALVRQYEGAWILDTQQ